MNNLYIITSNKSISELKRLLKSLCGKSHGPMRVVKYSDGRESDQTLVFLKPIIIA